MKQRGAILSMHFLLFKRENDMCVCIADTWLSDVYVYNVYYTYMLDMCVCVCQCLVCVALRLLYACTLNNEISYNGIFNQNIYCFVVKSFHKI